jgi:2-oxo-3-hexenedioate decarboxylase/2-keto-4-pentenoate hydratase
MSRKARIREAARFLLEEHGACRAFGPLPPAIAPRNVDEAYEIQEEFQRLLSRMHGLIGGYKVALTTSVMRRMLGADEPIAGAIFSKTIQRSPATVFVADFVHLGVECEIAFQMAAELPIEGAPYSRGTVAGAVGAAAAALELIDHRNADFSALSAQLLPLTADNAWNAGIVLGAPVADWQSIDLAGVRGTMVINDEVVGVGWGGDVMGHPLEALAWLANSMAMRGRKLLPGMIVMTGSVVALQSVVANDTVRLTMDGLGEVSLLIRP